MPVQPLPHSSWWAAALIFQGKTAIKPPLLRWSASRNGLLTGLYNWGSNNHDIGISQIVGNCPLFLPPLMKFMVNTLFEILPFAVGIAVSPVPIITVILSLFSSRAAWNGPAFVLGWALGILVVCIPVLLLTDIKKVSAETPPSTIASVLRITLGVFLLLYATRQWIKRPRVKEEKELPRWLKMIDRVSPIKVFGVGFFFADLTNPKNTALTIAGTLPIAHSGLDMGQKALLSTVFILISSLGVAIPVIYYLTGGESAKKILNNWKLWLIANNSSVMAILLLIFCVVLLANGIKGFA